MKYILIILIAFSFSCKKNVTEPKQQHEDSVMVIYTCYCKQPPFIFTNGEVITTNEYVDTTYYSNYDFYEGNKTSIHASMFTNATANDSMYIRANANGMSCEKSLAWSCYCTGEITLYLSDLK